MVNVHPGEDGKVRVVTVKTAKGTYKRPVIKTALILPNNTYCCFIVLCFKVHVVFGRLYVRFRFGYRIFDSVSGRLVIAFWKVCY